MAFHTHICSLLPGATTPKDLTCKLGKYGSLITFRQSEASKNGLPTPMIGAQLAQHVVGMNPKSLGSMEEDNLPSNVTETSNDEPQQQDCKADVAVNEPMNADHSQLADDSVDQDSKDYESIDDGNASDDDDNETRLFHQDFFIR